MSDCLQLTMMFPFILNRFLKHTHFKKPELSLFQRRTGITRSDHAVKFWLKCWILVAKTMVMYLKIPFQKKIMINCAIAWIMNEKCYHW